MVGFLECTYDRAEGFVEKKVGDELVLVPLSEDIADMNSVFACNELAAFILNCVDGVKSGEEILSCIVEEFEVSSELAAKDLNTFLLEAKKKGIIIPK